MKNITNKKWFKISMIISTLVLGILLIIMPDKVSIYTIMMLGMLLVLDSMRYLKDYLNINTINWLDIKDIDKYQHEDNLLFYQHNLVDEKSSRFQRGIFIKGNDKTSSFIKIYPQAGERKRIKKTKDYIHTDLEGDKCQITHFAIISKP